MSAEMDPRQVTTLFQVELIEEVVNPNKCRTCAHRERHQCGGRVIQYCGVLKSNRTDNGKKKIKCKDKACDSYKAEQPLL